MPLPPPRHQPKADDVRAVEVELMDSEVLRLKVKNLPRRHGERLVPSLPSPKIR